MLQFVSSSCVNDLITSVEGEEIEITDSYHSHSSAEALNALLTGFSTDGAVRELILCQ